MSKDEIQAKLKAMLSKVPPRINSAGVEATRNFLAWHKKASKLAESSSPSAEKLTDAYNSALQYYA